MNDSNASDGTLVRLACQGDASAFDQLVRRHYGAAYAVALAVLGSRSTAEDVCQDSWLRALERLGDCRDPERFVFWFLQIVRNRAHNRRDYDRVRLAEPLESGAAQGMEDPEQNLRRERLRIRLERAIGTLPEIEREVVLLHDLEGWGHRDIAQSLGISEGMSRQHLFQARRRLRAELAGHAGGGADNDG
ncbi:MAG: RNA polymerase sigma factor [Candidatus Krumholzibacteria bacterium]|nr:RNA polymerase sigma factor [Candidatus Krumholzibacteria bacterium]